MITIPMMMRARAMPQKMVLTKITAATKRAMTMESQMEAVGQSTVATALQK